jgi:hypothetical protein
VQASLECLRRCSHGSGAAVSDSPTKLHDPFLAQLALLLDAARAVVDGVLFGEVEEDDEPFQEPSA